MSLVKEARTKGTSTSGGLNVPEELLGDYGEEW